MPADGTTRELSERLRAQQALAQKRESVAAELRQLAESYKAKAERLGQQLVDEREKAAAQGELWKQQLKTLRIRGRADRERLLELEGELRGGGGQAGVRGQRAHRGGALLEARREERGGVEHEQLRGREEAQPAAQVDVVHGAVDEEAVLHHGVEPRLIESVYAEARLQILPPTLRALLQLIDLGVDLVSQLLLEVVCEATG